MPVMITQHSPSGWGQDSVSQYLDNCRTNQFAAFANKRPQFEDLVAIEEMFQRLQSGVINEASWMPVSFFLCRSHSAYLSAMGAVLAGQLFESQSLLRACLEQAAYGYFVNDDHERFELWMNRHENADTRKAMRTEFTHRKISDTLATADATLGKIYEYLYEMTIDYGAHPNERGVFSSSAIERSPSEKNQYRVVHVYLHGNGPKLDGHLKMAAQIGLCALQIARLISPERIQALGIQTQLDEMCKRY